MRAVELLPHDPAWAHVARAEAATLRRLLGDGLVAVHHIGSTAIAGIRAKPVVDLMAVVRDLSVLELQRDGLGALGYRWRGENGLPGRRYCTKDDPATGRRLMHLHGYAEGSPGIARHLAFRDHLRGNPSLALEYDREKERCQRLHRLDPRAYGDCKSTWIQRIEPDAVAAAGLAAKQPLTE